MRIPPEKALEIFRRDKFKCVYCDFDGSSFKNWAFLQIDHFIPKSKGGSDESANLVTACCICNQMKKDIVFSSRDEARREIQKWWDSMHVYWRKHVSDNQSN